MQDGIIKDILDGTNGGLDIFRDIYPMVTVNNGRGKERVGIETIQPGQKFSVRDESAPSAHFVVKDGYYYLHDFGGANRNMNAIDCMMDEEGKELKEVIKYCLTHFNITADKGNFTPNVRFEDALPTEKKGDKSWTTKEFTKAELNIFGRQVTADNLHFYNWELIDELREIITDKQEKLVARIKKSEPTRPIFVRTCYFRNDDNSIDHFYKIYEPKADKAYRFKHYPEGKKPSDYVHGLWECEKFLGIRPGNESVERLDALYIMSGERDAMNMFSLGNANKVVWFNSETSHVPAKVIMRLNRCAKRIVNVPDIDATGEEQGNRFARENWDIYTLRLPHYLLDIKDWRGNGMKDFRDFCYISENAGREVADMINNAHKMKFWSYTEKKDKDDNVIEEKVNLDTMNVVFALNVLGYRFATVRGEAFYYAQRHHIITKLTVQEIQREFVEYLTAHNVDDRVVKAIIGTNRFGQWCQFLDSPREADEMNLPYEQRYYLTDGWVDIKPDKVTKHRYNEMDYDIDAESIKAVSLGQYKPIFNFAWNEEQKNIDIDIPNASCKLLQFMIGTSMIYWQKDLEAMRAAAPDKWNQDNMPLDLQSKYLSEEERQEQVLSFENKMFCMGYMLSSWKDAAKPWAVYLMDNKVGDVNESNGGSGKSLFFAFMAILLKKYGINGKMKKIADNAHLYDGVDESYRLILFDDLDKKFNVEMLFSDITNDLYVNPKGKTPYSIPFKKSPKIGITTNFVPLNIDASVKRRLRFATCSDWFHVKTTTNGYESDYTPKQMFGMTLIDDFDEKDMSETLSCMFDCIRYYMMCNQHGIIKDCLLHNIEYRQLQVLVGQDFMDWFSTYFNSDGFGHLDQEINKRDAFMDCKQVCPHITSQNLFTRSLKNYCSLLKYTFNPARLCNTNDGRIMRRDKFDVVEKIYIEKPQQQ